MVYFCYFPVDFIWDFNEMVKRNKIYAGSVFFFKKFLNFFVCSVILVKFPIFCLFIGERVVKRLWNEVVRYCLI